MGLRHIIFPALFLWPRAISAYALCVWQLVRETLLRVSSSPLLLLMGFFVLRPRRAATATLFGLLFLQRFPLKGLFVPGTRRPSPAALNRLHALFREPPDQLFALECFPVFGTGRPSWLPLWCFFRTPAIRGQLDFMLSCQLFKVLF